VHVANAYTPTDSVVARPFLTFATSLAPGKCAKGVPAPGVLDGAPWLLGRPARDLDLIALVLVLRRGFGGGAGQRPCSCPSWAA
jgi:hypothetical protein